MFKKDRHILRYRHGPGNIPHVEVYCPRAIYLHVRFIARAIWRKCERLLRTNKLRIPTTWICATLTCSHPCTFDDNYITHFYDTRKEMWIIKWRKYLLRILLCWACWILRHRKINNWHFVTCAKWHAFSPQLRVKNYFTYSGRRYLGTTVIVIFLEIWIS